MTNVPGAANGCLDPETLAALVDGRLAPEERVRVQQHTVTCPDCYEVFRDVVRTWPESTKRDGEDLAPPAPVWSRYLILGGGLAAAAGLAVVLGLPGLLDRDAGERQDLRILVDAVGSARTIEGRLTGGFAWGPLETTRGTATSRLAPPIERAAADLEAAMARSRSGATLAAFGTSRLVTGNVSLAVAALEEATALEPGRADYLSDLAIAYLEQGREPGNEAAVVRALEVTDTAIALEPSMPEVLFNRAVILERLNQPEAARKAWLTYLAVPDDAAWQNEARQRLERLQLTGTRPQTRGLDAEPLRRELWGPLLQAWVDAAGDPQRLAAAMTAIRAKAADIERTVPDRMVRDFVASLARAERSTPLFHLALSGHEAYLRLQSALLGDQFDAAGVALRTALPALSQVDSPLYLTARFNEASLFYRRESTAATHQRYAELRGMAEARGYTGLVARADWMLGLTQALTGDHRGSTTRYEAALAGFDAIGDAANRAATLTLLAINYDNIGDPWRGWPLRLESMTQAPRVGVLLSAALSAADRGWPRAALVFADAALETARTAGSPGNIADALRTKAMLHARLDENEKVTALLTDARSLVADQRTSAWDGVRAEIDLAEAQSAGPARTARGIDTASEALDYFTRNAAPLRLPEARLVRASLYRLAGRPLDALRDVEHGLAVLETQRATVSPGRDQVTFEAVERSLLTQLVTLTADMQAPTDRAFLRVDASRGRDVVATLPPTSLAQLASDIPDDTTLAAFVVADDESFVWIVARGQQAFSRIAVGRRELTTLVQAATSPRHDRAAAAKLAQLLTAPIAAHRPAHSRWVIVPDGPIGALPFALLPGSGNDSLIAERTILIAPSVAAWLYSTRRSASPLSPRLLAVGNPTLNRSEYPDLGPLPEADLEADAVAALYPQDTILLRGASATREAMLAELPRASIVHVATHAVSHPWVSDASYLALAGPAPSRVTAADVRRLRLERTRLIVLAGCETASGGRPTLDSPLSLARAFLAAGATHVIGSLWRVSDRATRVLSTRFHEEFTRTGDAALSLRRAQLALATSEDPVLASPRQWAAFVIMGGSNGVGQLQ